jgi:hypothetical protein
MRIRSGVTQEFSIIFNLTENEAKAFHDIVAYGYNAFMEVFKEKLGKHYIEQHEEGAKSLFKAVSEQMPAHFARFDEARKIFNESEYKPSNKEKV